MSPLAHRRFLKMNGLGNEITVLDLRGTNLRVTAAEARAIAADPPSRFDQLMVLHDPATPGTDAFLSIYNTDGSESAACGNGTRCVAWAMAADPRMARPGAQTLRLETRAGILPTRRDGDLAFTVDMGPPRFGWDEIPVRDPVPDTRAVALPIGPAEAVLPGKAALVDMGNPHAIFFVADLDAHDLARLGPRLERHPFFPQRANISLARIAGPERIGLRVWERGAGLTRACGSAACAAVVAAARLGLASRRARVALPGGELLIDWRTEDGHVLMSGPVELEHEGTLRPDLFSGAA